MQKKNIFVSQLKLAAEIWSEIQKVDYPADRWLSGYFHQNRKKIGSRDRRFLSEIIYSLFRNKLWIEAWAKELTQPGNAFVCALLAAALEGQVSFSDFTTHWREQFQEMPFSEDAFWQLKEWTFPSSEQPKTVEEKLSLRFSFPLWLVRKWMNYFGHEECEKLLAICQERPLLIARTNTLKIDRETLLGKLRRKGCDLNKTQRSGLGIIFNERINLVENQEFQNGLFEIQDEGSQLICQHIDPKPGEVVWDVCAGGGGKSLALAAMMKNKGRIVATDIRAWKLEELKKRASRSGIYNIFPADLNQMQNLREMKNGADKIVIDAPCSGSGTLRRNPDAKWKLSEEKLFNFQKDQLAIIEKAIPYLKEGGRIFYITCSLESAENEEVMNQIFSKHTDLKKVAFRGNKDGFLRYLPQVHGTDGFFMAAAEKVRASNQEIDRD